MTRKIHVEGDHHVLFILRWHKGFITKESHHFIGLDEIIALQLECCNSDCRVRIALEPSRWDKEKLPSRRMGIPFICLGER